MSIRPAFARLGSSEGAERSNRPVATPHYPTTKETMTMRFMSMIRIKEHTGLVPSEQLMTEMGKLMEELTRDGKLISTAGLRPTSEGVRVRLRNGKLSM